VITLVDSNVILDLVTDDPKWGQWSADTLSRVADESALAINPLIFAEVSIGFSTIEELEELLPPEEFARLALPYEAAFLAGKAFLAYRRRGGRRSAPLHRSPCGRVRTAAPHTGSAAVSHVLSRG